jgi:hypothetical protein
MLPEIFGGHLPDLPDRLNYEPFLMIFMQKHFVNCIAPSVYRGLQIISGAKNRYKVGERSKIVLTMQKDVQVLSVTIWISTSTLKELSPEYSPKAARGHSKGTSLNRQNSAFGSRSMTQEVVPKTIRSRP